MKIKYFLVIAVLITSILVSANAVSAQDNSALIAQLQAQIVQLQAQLQALLAQQGGQTWCHIFNANLGFANSGSSEVSHLHTALQKQNISYGSDNTNKYSEDTAAAVVQFQAK